MAFDLAENRWCGERRKLNTAFDVESVYRFEQTNLCYLNEDFEWFTTFIASRSLSPAR